MRTRARSPRSDLTTQFQRSSGSIYGLVVVEQQPESLCIVNYALNLFEIPANFLVLLNVRPLLCACVHNYNCDNAHTENATCELCAKA